MKKILIVLIILGFLYFFLPIHTFAFSFIDRPSPADRLTPEQVKVYSDRIVIFVHNATWARFLDTNSMDPVINKDAMSIEIKPNSEKDIKVGDIISYKHGDHYIIHRVIEIGKDELGWFCITKGDNSLWQDPWKIRFEKISGIVIGILY